MICRYCGVETGSGVGHKSQDECIRALHDEIARARQLIDRVRENSIRSPGASGDGRRSAAHSS